MRNNILGAENTNIGINKKENEIFLNYFITSFSSAYKVYLKEDSFEVLHMDREFADVFKADGNRVDMEYFVNNHIHADDREMMRKFIDREYIIERLRKEDSISFSVREIFGDKQKTMKCLIIKGEDEYHAAIGFMDITDEVENARLRQKETLEHIGIIEGLASEYHALFYINFEDNIFNTYQVNENRLSDTKKLLMENSNPFELIAKFKDSPAVFEEDRYLFKDLTKDKVIKKLENTKKFTIEFRRDYGSGFMWSTMDVIKCDKQDEKANALIIGFAEKDKEIKRKFKEAKELENLKAIDGITSQYTTIYVIDTNTDEYNVVKNIEEIGKQYGGSSFLRGVRKYIGSEVYDSDKASFYENMNYDYINERLKTSSYYFEYRAYVNQIPIWHEMYISKIGDEGKILIAVVQKDKEILYKHVEDILTDHFEGIYICDIKKDKMKILKGTGGFAKFEGKYIPLSSTMAMFAENLTGDDRNFFINVYGNPENIKRILAKDSDIEYNYQSPNYSGELVWMKSEVHTLTYDEEGMPETAMVGISQIDTSQREKMKLNEYIKIQNEKLEKQQKDLEQALSMAQSSSRAKTTFLNNMSHDIRTPMNAIIGYTGLAASHIENTEHVKDYLSKISKSSEHLLSLINDVLDMSRIESGKMNIDEKEENLSYIVHTLRDIVAADIKAKNLDFYIDVVDVNNENIICDKLRLNQVLLNILSNAVKYTNPGGIISLRVIEKTVKKNGYATFDFIIKDNGIGMSKEFLSTIFDPFTRVNSSTVSGIQGTGLGMAISKNIIDMMGGKINIESKLDKGTTVTCEFDFKIVKGSKPDFHIPTLEGFRALVVDDDPNACISIAGMIRQIGMRDEWCTSGNEAVLRARDAFKIGEPFKVYIIDWVMPELNGIETARLIRKEIGKEIPIIILTAYDWSDIEEEAIKAGVTAFVSKPMFLSDLHKVLNRCIGVYEEETDLIISAEEYDFKGKRILLVEDNELNREIAEEILIEYGFEVDTAIDGNFAVEKMENAKEGDYDLVLMDIQMPTMDGYEATRRIRKLGTEISKIPILAMTANAFEEDRQAAIEAGMNEHIAKPIDVDKLKETLARFM